MPSAGLLSLRTMKRTIEIIGWGVGATLVHLVVTVACVNMNAGPIVDLLIFPVYILFPAGVGAFDAGFVAIPMASLLAGFIAALSCTVPSRSTRPILIVTLFFALSLMGSWRSKKAILRQKQKVEIARKEVAQSLSDPDLDLEKMFEEGGYAVPGVGKARGHDVLEFSYLIGAHAKEAAAKRAVPVLVKAIRDDEKSMPRITGGRAAAARTLFLITGTKFRYAGVDKDIAACRERTNRDPFGENGAKCTSLEELQEMPAGYEP